jgi:hypothetical protein
VGAPIGSHVRGIDLPGYFCPSRASTSGARRCFVEMLVGESLSRRHSGTIPGEARVARLPYAIVCSPEPPVAFRPDLSSTPADQSLATSRDKCRVPAGLGLRGLRGGLPGISPHPRSPGVPWVWHDAPLRVFLLQRIGTPHTLYLFQKYDTATACCAAMTEGAPFSTPTRQNSPSSCLAPLSRPPAE